MKISSEQKNKTVAGMITKKIIKKNTAKNSGFTLIEMLVAVGLFSVVMLVSVSAILSIIGNNKKAQGINNVVNNLNFAIESMVRDMKTGFLYKCQSLPIELNTTNLCATPGSPVDSVAFFSTLSGANTQVEYRFIPPATTTDAVYVPGHIVKTTGGGSPVDLTSRTDVDIKSMKMYINSPASGTVGASQPSIFLIIRGDANILDNQVTQFGLQTFISQRILNL